MKKFFVFFALFTAIFLMVSCGDIGEVNVGDINVGTGTNDQGNSDGGTSDKKQGELGGECYGNKTCNEGLVCEEESNTCIKKTGSYENNDGDQEPEQNGNDADATTPDNGDSVFDNDTDTDSGDSTPDDADTASEQTDDDDGDSTHDDADSDSDSDSSDSTADDADTSDSQPDEDADADSGEAEEHCETVDGKLWWSSKKPEKPYDPAKPDENKMDWEGAINHCKELKESNACGYSDWHLPIIDELKTLLKWRRDSQCKVSETDDHLSFNDYWTCSSCCHDCTLGGGGECNYSSYFYDGRYSKLGDSGSLWSSSVPTEYTHSAWTVNFNAAQVYNKSKSNTTEVYVRCVRGAQ